MALQLQRPDPGRDPLPAAYLKLPSSQAYRLMEDGSLNVTLLVYANQAKRLENESLFIDRDNRYLPPTHELSLFLAGKTELGSMNANKQTVYGLLYRALKALPDLISATDV